MNTEQILKLACDRAGFNKIKGESRIYWPGENIRRVLAGIDIYPDDLVQAKEDGFDLVLSHHPPDKNFTEAFCEEIDDQIHFLVSIGVDEDRARRIVPTGSLLNIFARRSLKVPI